MDNLTLGSNTTEHHLNAVVDVSQIKTIDETIKMPPPPENIRICLVGRVVDDRLTIEAAQSFGVEIVTSQTGSEFIDDTHWTTYFILDDFETTIYETIHKAKHKIMGPPALQHAAQLNNGLPTINRPIYNYSMKGVKACFEGIRKKDELTRLVYLIYAMGGSIRKEHRSSTLTHMICIASNGVKYHYGKIFNLSVLRPGWIYDAWNQRDDVKFIATTPEFQQNHKLTLFEGLKICFLGFPENEKQHMIEVLMANGGKECEIDDVECSHVVVDEHMIQTIPTLVNNRTHILKADWFWYTIQDGCAEEERHKFDDYLKSILNTPGRRDSHPTPNKNKRKQRFDGTPVSTSKRRSSVSDAGLLSMSGSLLDYTISPDKHESRGKHISDTEPTIEEKSSKKASMRYNHFMDFFHTESNYVGILNTILNLFKIPLEQDKDEDKMILNKSEIKSIFSNFLPIHQVHKHMLDSLEKLRTNWSEDGSIGQIIMDNRNDLIKAYPPYVNFFEQMKEALIQCDKENPRFHAFLKINQSKPECGRQSLQDLMIRPVQRLPSISLLLNDILKHTSKSNPDHRKLDDALKAIKEVMTYINEDKRKTEGQLAMFDIFNDIDNCPPHLVSSHRNFVSKCEVTELSDNLSGRGDSLMLFLFSDTLEMCKKRSRGHSAKSPSTTISGLNTTRMTTTKPYKHIKLLPLSAIRFVYDIRDSPRAFSLVCKSNQDAKEKMYSFNICDEEIDKIIYLRGVCKQLAENACVTDTDNFMATVESQEIDIDISEVNLGTLSKAYKFATRTRLKVGRAFSFHKTPSKLKRAVSTMIPSPFGSTNSIQATSQLANMKLGSCNNINEVQEENSDNSPTSSEILIAPMSVQPVRKAKGATIAVSTLRRI